MLSHLVFTLVFAAQAPGVTALEPPPRDTPFWKTAPPPEKCVAVLDDMGPVGFRIADAQQFAESTMAGMVKRVGWGGIAYEGMKKNAEKMKKLVGSATDTTLQEDQLEYYKRCERHAKYRLRIRFKRRGKGKKKREVLTLTCRPKDTAAKKAKTKIVLKGKSVLDVRKKLEDAIPTFCPEIVGRQLTPAPAQAQKGGAGSGLSGSEKRRQEKLKSWTPPPQRN